MKRGANAIDRKWKAKVKYALDLKGKTQRDMAEDLGVSYSYIRNVMCGLFSGEGIVSKIENYCGLKNEKSDEEKGSG